MTGASDEKLTCTPASSRLRSGNCRADRSSPRHRVDVVGEDPFQDGLGATRPRCRCRRALDVGLGDHVAVHEVVPQPRAVLPLRRDEAVDAGLDGAVAHGVDGALETVPVSEGDHVCAVLRAPRRSPRA